MSSKWKTVCLGELISHKKGFAFKSSDYVDVGVPVVRVSNFTDDSISSDDLKFVSTSIAKINHSVCLRANDIVVATVGSWPNNPASVVGRTISVPVWAENALMNQNSVILRSKSGSLIDQRFIFYQMKSKAFASHVISKAQGSANQASITLDAIFSFPLSWPESEERASVVSVLDVLDNRITLLRDTNATLEAIAQALFKSWFVDFDPVRTKMAGRAPEGMDEATAALFPDALVETELGLVPKGWVIQRLGDVVARVTKGTTPTTLKRPFVDSGINFVKAESMTDDGDFLPAKFAFIDSETHELLKRSQLKAGDVLISIAGTIGRTAIVTDDFLPANTNQAVAIVRPTPVGIPSGLIVRFLNTAGSKQLLGERVVQAVQANLSLGTLSDLKLVLPESDLIRNLFKIAFEPIDLAIAANRQKVRTLDLLRNTLLPRLISGQLRLPELMEAKVA